MQKCDFNTSEWEHVWVVASEFFTSVDGIFILGGGMSTSL